MRGLKRWGGFALIAVAFVLSYTVIIWSLLSPPAVTPPVVQPAAPAMDVEPYGGCDEAWQAPKSEGAQWCRDHGYVVEKPGPNDFYEEAIAELEEYQAKHNR